MFHLCNILKFVINGFYNGSLSIIRRAHVNYYVAKSEALLHIHDIIEKADFKGFVDDNHDSNSKAHVFETIISKEKW